MRDLSIRAPLYALAAVVAIPIAILLYSSGPAGITSSMEDPQFMSSLGVTVLGASIATALNALLGTPAAYALARRMVRWHGALYDLLLSPVSIPHTVVGIMLLLVFSPASPLYAALGALNPLDTLWGMSLAMFYVSAPIYVMAMREHFERSDPELEHFMGSLGLAPSAVFYSILVRGSIGSIARISLLSMGRAISEFGSLVILAYSVSLAPLFHYVKPATVLIWYKYDVYGLSSAVGYASALLLVTLALSMLAYLASGDRGEGEGTLARGIQRAPRGLRVGPGERALLCGPNGSGKTTLMLGVIGAIESRGGVTVMGRDVSGLPTHERGIAYVPAQPVIPGWMRVRELSGLLPGSAGADRMLEEFGLRWASDRRAGELSTGERKVVQISMALSSAARAILLDEPFSNLSGEWASTLDGLLKAERRPLVISHQERVPGFDIYVRLPLDREGDADLRCPAADTFSRGDGPPFGRCNAAFRSPEQRARGDSNPWPTA